MTKKTSRSFRRVAQSAREMVVETETRVYIRTSGFGLYLKFVSCKGTNFSSFSFHTNKSHTFYLFST